MKKLKDSGKRVEHANGALKEPSDGRGRYDLLSTFATRRKAIHYEAGAEKYSDRNWEGGIAYSKCVDSLKRHLDQWIEGKTDEDHLAAVGFWSDALLHFTSLNRNDLDDRPTYD